MQLCPGTPLVFRLCWQYYTVNNHLNGGHAERLPNKLREPLLFPEAIVHLSRMTLYDLCISHHDCQRALGGEISHLNFAL